MIEQAVRFCDLYAQIVNFSIEIPDANLNNSLFYVQRNSSAVRKMISKFVSSMTSSTQNTVKNISNSTFQRQVLAKTTLEDNRQVIQIENKISPTQSLNQVLKPIILNAKPQNSLGTDNKVNNTQNLKQLVEKPIKLVTFKISESDKQSKIIQPTASSNYGCLSSFKRKLNSIIQCDYCADICGGQLMNNKRVEPFEIQGTEKELKKIITSRTVPSITKS